MIPVVDTADLGNSLGCHNLKRGVIEGARITFTFEGDLLTVISRVSRQVPPLISLMVPVPSRVKDRKSSLN